MQTGIDTLDVKPEFKDQYTAEDLRTIQDWIVKRHLSGIPGVVEFSLLQTLFCLL